MHSGGGVDWLFSEKIYLFYHLYFTFLVFYLSGTYTLKYENPPHLLLFTFLNLVNQFVQLLVSPTLGIYRKCSIMVPFTCELLIIKEKSRNKRRQSRWKNRRSYGDSRCLDPVVQPDRPYRWPLSVLLALVSWVPFPHRNSNWDGLRIVWFVWTRATTPWHWIFIMWLMMEKYHFYTTIRLSFGSRNPPCYLILAPFK
jgi:hypothetical protein